MKMLLRHRPSLLSKVWPHACTFTLAVFLILSLIHVSLIHMIDSVKYDNNSSLSSCSCYVNAAADSNQHDTTAEQGFSDPRIDSCISDLNHPWYFSCRRLDSAMERQAWLWNCFLDLWIWSDILDLVSLIRAHNKYLYFWSCIPDPAH